ncbi:MAG: hypothetical protein ACOH5I_21920 [Oligoflexus sp.]
MTKKATDGGNTQNNADGKKESESNPKADGNEGKSDDPKSDDKVDYATYDKAMKTAAKRKERIDQLEKELADREAAEKKARNDKLKEEGNTAELLALKEQELADAKQKIADTESRMLASLKQQAFTEQVGPLKHSKYMSLVEWENMKLDSDGELDPTSVKAVVDAFRKDHGELIKGASGTLPGGAPKPALKEETTTVDRKELTKIWLKEKGSSRA